MPPSRCCSLRRPAPPAGPSPPATSSLAPASLEKIDDGGVTIAPPGGGKSEVVGFDKLLQLQQNKISTSDPADGTFVVDFADGSRLVGRPAQSDSNDLQFDSQSLGRLAADPSRVRSIHRPGVAVGPPDATQDVVRLTNGDRAAGIFQSLDDQKVMLADGTSLPLASVAAIDLAVVGPPKPAKADGRTFRVGLTDGSAVNCAIEGSDGKTLRFTPAGGKAVEVPLSSVTSIEQVNGPVVWLSALTPVKAERTPYLETAAAADGPAYLADRSITGAPIAAAGQTFSRGLGVHSRSVLTFAVPEGARTFRTQFALMDGLPYADVSVKILIDGKPAFEAQNVRSGALGLAVERPVAGAKRVTLEVGYGENYDVQDRFNWVQPAFVK